MTLSSEANDNLDLGTPSRDGQLVDRTGYAFLYSEKHVHRVGQPQRRLVGLVVPGENTSRLIADVQIDNGSPLEPIYA